MWLLTLIVQNFDFDVYNEYLATKDQKKKYIYSSISFSITFSMDFALWNDIRHSTLESARIVCHHLDFDEAQAVPPGSEILIASWLRSYRTST